MIAAYYSIYLAHYAAIPVKSYLAYYAAIPVILAYQPHGLI